MAFNKIVVFAVLSVFLAGCSIFPNQVVHTGICKLIEVGITTCENKIGNEAGIFESALKPVILKVDMENIIDNVQEIWDNIPNEQKYEAALKVLQYLNEVYCGEEPKVSDLKIEAQIMNILKQYTVNRA